MLTLKLPKQLLSRNFSRHTRDSLATHPGPPRDSPATHFFNEFFSRDTGSKGAPWASPRRATGGQDGPTACDMTALTIVVWGAPPPVGRKMATDMLLVAGRRAKQERPAHAPYVRRDVPHVSRE